MNTLQPWLKYNLMEMFMILQDHYIDRKQWVLLNGECSNVENISTVIPQGSVLVLLLSLHINDVGHL